MTYIRTIGITTPLLVVLLALLLGLGIAYAASREISRDIPGSITINIVSIEEILDFDRDGSIDHLDLLAVSRKLNTRAVGDVPEDVNGDGVVDVLDLAIVASYFGRDVPV